MTELKAILFDIENTLFDSEAHKKKCVVFAVQAMLDAGLKIEKKDAEKLLWKEYLKFFHGPNVITDFLKNNNIFDEKLLEAGINGYKKGWTEKIITYPGVKETLTELKSMGFRLAVVTDAPLNSAKKILDGLNLSDLFEEVAAPKTKDDNYKRKPSPELFIEVLDKLGINPEDAAHVGDRLGRDIKGANEVGLISIYAKYGDIFLDTNYKGKPDYEINAFNELLGIVYSIKQKT